jgi:hypothetical protein
MQRPLPDHVLKIVALRFVPNRVSLLQSDGLGGSIMSKIKRRTTTKANAKPRPIATSNPRLLIVGA